MSTILEIQKPELTYCKKYDLHCPCPKCKPPKHWNCGKCWLEYINYNYEKFNFCDVCKGPLDLENLEPKTLESKLLDKIFAHTPCPQKINPKEYAKTPLNQQSYIIDNNNSNNKNANNTRNTRT